MSGGAIDRVRDWPARLAIDPTAFVAPGAVVVGEVTLGPRSSVWFGAVVRGDGAPISVGADSNLQDGVVVHVDEGLPAVVGARVTVGHRAIIHGCVIEDDCLIGMGAIVLSGSRVGAGSLIGAGALVREGQVVPPGSVALGTPARVVGPVGESHRRAIQNGAEHYAALSRSYLARGFARPLPAANADTGTGGRAAGPLTYLEWGALLGALAEGPAWARARLTERSSEAWRRAPAPGRWSALEVVCHLADVDREVYLPRVERMRVETLPAFQSVDPPPWAEARKYREREPAAAIADWGEARERLIERLAPLRREDWARVAVHSVSGHVTLGDFVRGWTDHDLAHRRQMAEALGAFA